MVSTTGSATTGAHSWRSPTLPGERGRVSRGLPRPRRQWRTADEGVATLLLEDIRRIFADKGVTRLPSGEIVERLLLLEERPWPEWGRDHRGITPSRLAKLLEPFNVHPGTIWLPNGQTPKGYKLEDFADAFQRYLTPVESPDGPVDTPDEAVV